MVGGCHVVGRADAPVSPSAISAAASHAASPCTNLTYLTLCLRTINCDVTGRHGARSGGHPNPAQGVHPRHRRAAVASRRRSWSPSLTLSALRRARVPRQRSRWLRSWPYPPAFNRARNRTLAKTACAPGSCVEYARGSYSATMPLRRRRLCHEKRRGAAGHPGWPRFRLPTAPPSPRNGIPWLPYGCQRRRSLSATRRRMSLTH